MVTTDQQARGKEEEEKRAGLATEEAIQKKKETEKANLAGQATESENAGIMSKKAKSAINIIPPDNEGLLSGSIKLTFDPGTSGSKITRITKSLSKISDVRIGSTGFIAGKGSWVGLFLKNPMPLFQVLHKIEVVQQLAIKGNNIQVMLQEDQ